MAWRTPGQQVVQYRRGISFRELLKHADRIRQQRLPFIIHFRFATIGAPGLARLCHPFPISKELDDMSVLRGSNQAVVAHNGTWRDIGDALNSQLVKQLINDGGWSDSALIAWVLGKGKEARLDQNGYGNRLAFLSVYPNGVEGSGLRLWGKGWVKEGEVWYSNNGWRYMLDTRGSYRASSNRSYGSIYTHPLCQNRKCGHSLSMHHWRGNGCSVNPCPCEESLEACQCQRINLTNGCKYWVDKEGKWSQRGMTHTPSNCWVPHSPDPCRIGPETSKNTWVDQIVDRAMGHDTKLLTQLRADKAPRSCVCGGRITDPRAYHGEHTCGVGPNHPPPRPKRTDCACEKGWLNPPGAKHSKRQCTVNNIITYSPYYAGGGDKCHVCHRPTNSRRDDKPFCYSKECEAAEPRRCFLCLQPLTQVGWKLGKPFCYSAACVLEAAELEAAEKAAREAKEQERIAVEQYTTGEFALPGLGKVNKTNREYFTASTSTTLTVRRRADATGDTPYQEAEKKVAGEHDCEMCRELFPSASAWKAVRCSMQGYWVCNAANCYTRAINKTEAHPEKEARHGMILAEEARIVAARAVGKKDDKTSPPDDDDWGGYGFMS